MGGLFRQQHIKCHFEGCLDLGGMEPVLAEDQVSAAWILVGKEKKQSLAQQLFIQEELGAAENFKLKLLELDLDNSLLCNESGFYGLIELCVGSFVKLFSGSTKLDSFTQALALCIEHARVECLVKLVVEFLFAVTLFFEATED